MKTPNAASVIQDRLTENLSLYYSAGSAGGKPSSSSSGAPAGGTSTGAAKGIAQRRAVNGGATFAPSSLEALRAKAKMSATKPLPAVLQ